MRMTIPSNLRIVEADLVTAAVLITFGVCYGFLSPCQLIVLCLVEPLAMKFNEHIVVNFLKVSRIKIKFILFTDSWPGCYLLYL